ncbi:hypothetical protein [Elioraea rosea]|uniref:hypothetical protein n=1 Tax=Elioraea rosea TaxID=2492390 RepID=UPI0013A640D5|nr:hypothetical protein [Elioraea rosea]
MRVCTFAAVIAGFVTATAPALAAPIIFSYTGSLQIYALLDPGDYRITAAGASGGPTNVKDGGFGALAEGIFTFNGTETLNIIVGRNGGLGFGGGGGGGGSFVFLLGSPATPLVVAGGGGGANGSSTVISQTGLNASLTLNGTAGGNAGGAGGTAGFGGTSGESGAFGGGGGGFLGAGIGVGGNNWGGGAATGTAAGGSSGTSGGNGGYGGGAGGGGFGSGGGGGGFSGGGGGGSSQLGGGPGGGGGSYVNSLFGGYIPGSQSLSLVDTFGAGSVTIEFLGRGGGTAVPAPGGLAVFAVALFGLAMVRRVRTAIG